MNNVIDINKYILSDDIRKYFERHNIKLELKDIVTLITYQHSVPFNKKEEDYHRIIEEYEKPDSLIKHSEDNENVISYIRHELDKYKLAKEEFFDNKDAIYEFRSFYDDEDGIPWDDNGRYSSVDECIKACKKLDMGSKMIKLSVYRTKLNNVFPSTRAFFDENYKLIEVEKFDWPSVLSEHNIVPNIDDILPFSQGDIVVDKSRNDNKPLLIIEEFEKGNKNNLWPSICLVNDNGELQPYGGRKFITNYETYKGDKNTNEYKLLLLVSDFLRGIISIECFIDHIGHYYDLSRNEVKNNHFHPSYPFVEETERMKPPVWTRVEKEGY